MKSILYMLILFFSLLNADELDNALKNNQNKWQNLIIKLPKSTDNKGRKY